jgi:RNA polymerase sigma-70 factor, ECF subfamily
MISFWLHVAGFSRAMMGDQLKKIADERDAGAFQSLFETFWPKVRAMLMRQGTDVETAEEIAQETMLAVWRKSHQFSADRGSVSAWIYGIARNLRIVRVRQQQVWQRYYDEFETMERLLPTADGAKPFEQHRGEIEKALGALPPEQLQVIQLAFVEGLSQTEIAARLDLPLGTVKSRIRLAYEKLRGAMECGL